MHKLLTITYKGWVMYAMEAVHLDHNIKCTGILSEKNEGV